MKTFARAGFGFSIILLLWTGPAQATGVSVTASTLVAGVGSTVNIVYLCRNGVSTDRGEITSIADHDSHGDPLTAQQSAQAGQYALDHAASACQNLPATAPAVTDPAKAAFFRKLSCTQAAGQLGAAQARTAYHFRLEHSRWSQPLNGAAWDLHCNVPAPAPDFKPFLRRMRDMGVCQASDAFQAPFEGAFREADRDNCLAGRPRETAAHAQAGQRIKVAPAAPAGDVPGANRDTNAAAALQPTMCKNSVPGAPDVQCAEP